MDGLHGEGQSVAANRIVLLDEHRSYGEAIRLALSLTDDLRVVAAEVQPEVGLRRIDELRPDMVVTSYRLGVSHTGVEVAQHVRSEPPGRRSVADVPVVILTAYPTPGLVRAVEPMNAVSVISKTLPITEIVSGIRVALSGETVFLGVSQDPYALTKAELEVLERLARGQNATTIANELHLSVHAIRARIRGLLTKTSSTSQLEAVAKAMSAGVVAPPAAVTTST